MSNIVGIVKTIESIAKAKLKLKIYTRLYLYIKYKLESKKNKDITSEPKEDLEASILLYYLEEKEFNLSNTNSTDNWLLNSLFNYECNETTLTENCNLYFKHYLKPKLYTSKSIEKRKKLLISFIENLIDYLENKNKTDTDTDTDTDITDTVDLLRKILNKLKREIITNENINNIINEISLIINTKINNNIGEIAIMSILETLKPGNALDTNRQPYYNSNTDTEANKVNKAVMAAAEAVEAAALANLTASMSDVAT